MNIFKLIAIASPLILMQCCGDKTKKIIALNKNQTCNFEIRDNDTVNRINCNGDKQGKWVVLKTTVIKAGEQASSVKFESGFYINNKEEGFWKRYYPDGKVKDSVNYKNGVVIPN